MEKWTDQACVLSNFFFFFFFLLFIFFFFLNFLTLQYCIGFAIYQHESATGIHVFPILNPPPSSLPIPSLWVVPVYQPQTSSITHRTWTGDSFPIWYYTCFNTILPIIPPFPSPTESERLFYTSESLLLSGIQGYSEKAMAPHSSTLAWKIPWIEEPGRLQSMESLRVGPDWATSPSLFTFMHWRRKWQPTPVFLPGESQGQGSLVGCHLWGRTESDTTEVT